MSVCRAEWPGDHLPPVHVGVREQTHLPTLGCRRKLSIEMHGNTIGIHRPSAGGIGCPILSVIPLSQCTRVVQRVSFYRIHFHHLRYKKKVCVRDLGWRVSPDERLLASTFVPWSADEHKVGCSLDWLDARSWHNKPRAFSLSSHFPCKLGRYLFAQPTDLRYCTVARITEKMLRHFAIVFSRSLRCGSI